MYRCFLRRAGPVDTRVDTAGELGFVVAPGLRSVRWWLCLWCATTPTLYHATPCSLTASARAICSVTNCKQTSRVLAKNMAMVQCSLLRYNTPDYLLTHFWTLFLDSHAASLRDLISVGQHAQTGSRRLTGRTRLPRLSATSVQR
jgi:hypothetical protein